MAAKTWICQRSQNGQKCGVVNPKRKQICRACGKRRPPTKKPAHRKVLEHPYPWWVERFGIKCPTCSGHGKYWFESRGEQGPCATCDGVGKLARCGICGAGPTEGTGKLDRDHNHKTGEARGLLCFVCNRALNRRVTPEWLRTAADYLERPGVPP